MSAEPLVTIVTPTRNMARFLPWAIGSVEAQDHPDIEYVVVDGGSDAETPALVERSNQVNQYVREPDRGQSHAINKGFGLAAGDILGWLNADDYYFPDAVSRAVAAFTADPELDVFYGDAVYVDVDGQFVRYFTEVEPFDVDRLRTSGDFICQPTTFFRKRALERVGLLDEALHYTMDWDLWCRLARAGCRFHYEPALIAANREHPDTKTLAGGATRLREIFQTNLRHKSGRIPWASLAFALHQAEVTPILGPAISRLLEVKRGLVGRRAVRPLYGLYPDARAAQEVRISVPVYGDRATHIELDVGLATKHASQSVAVHANGHELGLLQLTTASPRCREQLELRDSPAHRLDLRLRAQHAESGQDICFRLSSVRIRRGEVVADP